jgi:hypothetical protein
MILTSADGRREIDLLPPGASSSDNGVSPPSAPVCPQGIVSSSGDGFEEPGAPGEAPLDAELARLRESFPAPEGGAP